MEEAQYTQYLEELASGYQRSQVLFTALRTNIFEHLKAPVPSDALAQQLGWSPRGLRMLLDALLVLGLVEKGENGYQNSPVAEACLVAGGGQDQRHILLHKGNAYERWGRLEEAVRTGAAPARGQAQRSPEELRAFICGMADVGRSSADMILDKVDLAEHRVLLDIGTGPGTYAIAMLQRFPEMRAILLDLPEVLPITREEVAKAGLEDRVELIAGDMNHFEFPSTYDLVLISNIIHSFSATANREILRRCYEGMAPGGRLIIKDFLVDPERTGPAFSLMFALHMLLGTEGGDVYTTEEVKAWTDAAGFDGGELIDLTEQTRLWVVQKS